MANLVLFATNSLRFSISTIGPVAIAGCNPNCYSIVINNEFNRTGV